MRFCFQIGCDGRVLIGNTIAIVYPGGLALRIDFLLKLRSFLLRLKEQGCAYNQCGGEQDSQIEKNVCDGLKIKSIT